MQSTTSRSSDSRSRRLGLTLSMLALLGCSCSSGSSSDSGDGGGGGGGIIDDSKPPTIGYFAPAEGFPIGFDMRLDPGVTNSPTSFSLISGVLPLGVEFNTATGAFTGRPLLAGTTTLGVRATNAKGFNDTSFDLQITPPPAARFLFVANAEDDTLSSYAVDALTGALHNAGFAPAGDEPSVVAASAGGSYVAVGATLSGDVSIFKVKAKLGRPVEVASSPTIIGSAIVDLVFHPSMGSLYVLAAADGTQDLIYTFSFTPKDGALVSLTPTPMSVPEGSTALVADPLGRALYLSHGAGLRNFAINPSGTLIDLGDVNSLDAFQGVAVLPDGSAAYSVNQTQQDIYRFPIDASGSLGLGTLAANLAGSMALELALSGDSANLYVADGAGSIEQFSVGLGGSLAPLAPPTVSVGSGLAGLATSPAGGGAWVSRGGVNEVVSLTAAVGGALTPDLDTPMRVHRDPRGLALAPAQNSVDMATQNLFAVNSDNDDFNQFAVGLGGVMGPLFPPMLMTGSQPVSVVVHPTYEALYVCNEMDTTRAVEAFFITINGQALPLQQFAAAAGATSLVLGVNGTWGHLVIDDVADSIQTVSISSTGTLSTTDTLAGVPVTGRPARHPNGRWLYLPDGALGTIDTYSVNASDGALTNVDSDSADLGVNAVAIDPTGRFLYSVNDDAVTDRVRGFAISATDGTLTELVTSPYALDAMAKDAIDVAVHPSGRTLYVATRDSDLVAGEGAIHTYSIEVDPMSGAAFGSLTLLGSSMTFPLESPSDIEVDAAGATLYVSIEKTMSRIEAYSIDGSGALSPAPVDVEDTGAMTHAMALKRRTL